MFYFCPTFLNELAPLTTCTGTWQQSTHWPLAFETKIPFPFIATSRYFIFVWASFFLSATVFSLQNFTSSTFVKFHLADAFGSFCRWRQRAEESDYVPKCSLNSLVLRRLLKAERNSLHRMEFDHLFHYSGQQRKKSLDGELESCWTQRTRRLSQVISFTKTQIEKISMDIRSQIKDWKKFWFNFSCSSL